MYILYWGTQAYAIQKILLRGLHNLDFTYRPSEQKLWDPQFYYPLLIVEPTVRRCWSHSSGSVTCPCIRSDIGNTARRRLRKFLKVQVIHQKHMHHPNLLLIIFLCCRISFFKLLSQTYTLQK
jgi:hypothetical protein